MDNIKTKILILAANPSDTKQLELEHELLKLELVRQNSTLKEVIELKFELSVQADDLQCALLDFKPDIVHLAIAERLKELNSQHLHQQNLEQQRVLQKHSRNSSINSIDALVFLHCTPEDLDLTKEILPWLEKSGIDYMLPLSHSKDTKADEICQDIDNNILNCDAVLILYEKSSPVWVREQLTNCRTLQRERKTPLKIIAVHKGKQEKLNCGLKNDCPPEKVETYLSRFIEALA